MWARPRRPKAARCLRERNAALIEEDDPEGIAGESNVSLLNCRPKEDELYEGLADDNLENSTDLMDLAARTKLLDPTTHPPLAPLLQ